MLTNVLVVVMGASLVWEGGLDGPGPPRGRVFAAMAYLGLLGLVFGAFGLALFAATGRPGLSRGLQVAAVVLACAVSGLGGIVDWLKPLQKYLPFYHYSGHDPLVNGLDWPSVGIAAASAALLVAAAVVGFRRRDAAAWPQHPHPQDGPQFNS
ncbi:hypothetical protein [Sinomonas atrocyanea]|uniref:hypothetical protein n=1 Tax=Sinomonas atrocyanea TaxID=37927 RepID=UPI00278AA297|nr:hypothetical protein [Sinomonas atrocyanea]MDQ0259285.1 hypothetical protein [Sinomonas atrocyanea]MDR6622594.1 hypothetical protein [Sinomonas atrocyanea]